MRWTHHIESVLINPMNQRDMKISDTLENEYIYAYRKTLDGGLTLIGDDYLLIESYKTTRRFDKFTYEIRDNGTLNSSYEFTIEDCHFYPRTNTVTIKVTPRDIYTAIQENEDIEVNALIENRVAVTADIYSEWTFYGKVKSSISENDGDYGLNTGIYVSLTVLGAPVYAVVFATETVTIHKDDEPPVGWVLYVDLDDYKIYQRLPVDFPALNTNAWVSGTYGLEWPVNTDYQWVGYKKNPFILGVKYNDPTINGTESLYNYFDLGFPVNTYIGDTNMNDFWLKKSIYNLKANVVFVKTYKAIELKSIFERIISLACPLFTGSIKSNFLFNDTVEIGRTAFGYVYPKYIIEISDFKKPNAYEKATKSICTWKQIIEYFCLKFNLRWCIDSNNDIRIEHISYFKTVAIGLDKSSDVDMIDDYSFVQNDKPNREYQTESNAYNEDFGQIEIIYGSIPALNGVKENTKTRSLSNFYTDVDGLNTHLDELPDTGFVLVDVVAGAIVKGTGFKSGETNLQNSSLSNANCLNLYYRHEAYQQEFTIGGHTVSAITLKKMRKHIPDFTSDSIPDVTKNIITSLGIGEVEKLTYPLTEEYTFNAELRYE